MIFKLQYPNVGFQEKDGQKIPVPLNPSQLLEHFGPFLEVSIIPSKIIREKLEAEGKEIPSAKVKALIDSGVSTSVILPEIARKVDLVHTGYQKITSVQDEQLQPVYFGAIAFSWGKLKETPLVACPLKNFGCLIGRDVLKHWYLTYDGAGGAIVICD